MLNDNEADLLALKAVDGHKEWARLQESAQLK